MNKKGLISGLIGAGVIAVLLFAASSAVNMTKNDASFLKIQAVAETQIETDNLVRILDKAAANETLANLDGETCAVNTGVNWGEEIRGIFTDVIVDFSVQNTVECTLVELSSVGYGSEELDIEANIKCESQTKNFTTKDERTVKFWKDAESVNVGGPANVCMIFDRVSGCAEEPEECDTGGGMVDCRSCPP